jgi:hypothetical protein
MNNVKIKAELHRILKEHLERNGLSILEQVILVTDISEAIETRIAVFQNHAKMNSERRTVKSEPEPMYLRRYE